MTSQTSKKLRHPSAMQLRPGISLLFLSIFCHWQLSAQTSRPEAMDTAALQQTQPHHTYTALNSGPATLKNRQNPANATRPGPAATGVLDGYVLTSDDSPVPGVTVQLAETRVVRITDKNGYFQLKAPAGKYKMLVSYTGSRTFESYVQIIAADTVHLEPIHLQEDIHSLSEVTVKGRRNRYGSKNSIYVMRLPISDMENPQVYTSISGQLLQEQNLTSYQDAFKNISGSGVPSTANNGRVTMSSRGFKVRSQIVDGVSGYTMTDIDPANIERIEVIKGPSSTLFGAGAGGSTTSFGGVVNIVTKTPYDGVGGSASYTGGSYGLNRITFDGNTPLNSDHTVLFRMTGAHNDNKSNQDAGFLKSTFLAPSLYVQVNNRVSVNVNTEFFHRDATSPYWFTPSKKTVYKTAPDLPINYNLSFINNDVYFTASQFNVNAQIKTQISKQWLSQTSFAHTTNDVNGPTVSLTGVTDSTLYRSISAGLNNYQSFQIQQNFIGDFKIADKRNRIVLGLNYLDFNSSSNTTSIKMDTANFLHPDNSYYNFNMAAVNNRLADATYKKNAGDQKSYSAYVSDVFSLRENLNLMASVRVDRFEDGGTANDLTGKLSGKYGQTALSPKFGVVYQPVLNRVSLFANYQDGFNNVAGTDYEGNSFKPENGKQFEAGTKLNLLHGLLTGTLSYYYIKVENTLRDDLEHDGFSIQNGTQQSKGFEAELTSNPLPGLDIFAGYAYNDSKYLKADDGLVGTRPDGAGPKNTANLWASYKVLSGWAKGLGIGFGGIYGTQLDNLKGFTGFVVPDYLITDGSLFYERSIYRLTLKVNNLGNERYWNNRLQLQQMRNVSASIMIHF
ncbi:iron complex outermembrane recepter protein [Arachidicoccus rhizosphaerae]|uniref:Iron complex outermembrane recepter protein n=1 Tax=Arachidicoccus rhizosphaerae TaxID=551991 RepID=A0A1H3Y0Q8_9BACT|nr:TonB-dependent siderophore receptor [Arachidicoccus rhizosphaerae]SEA05173.1 iron complex outermembrane recepter protein [Arachidicoccus rhizosphaerae]